MSISGTRVFRRNPDIMRGFDFLEGFNSCESPESNAKAMELAARFNLPTFGGSDAHRADCAGMAYTEFAQPVTSESELIRYIKTKPHVECGGDYYNSTLKGKIGIFSHLMPSGFWVYNRIYQPQKKTGAVSAAPQGVKILNRSYSQRYSSDFLFFGQIQLLVGKGISQPVVVGGDDQGLAALLHLGKKVL
jgi:hypothetical protein